MLNNKQLLLEGMHSQKKIMSFQAIPDNIRVTRNIVYLDQAHEAISKIIDQTRQSFSQCVESNTEKSVCLREYKNGFSQVEQVLQKLIKDRLL